MPKKETDQHKAWAEHVARDSYPKIDESALFLSIFTEHYAKDATCMAQLGYAIMLDKPLFFVADINAPIPRSLKKLAVGISYYDPARGDADLERASAQLQNMIKAFYEQKLEQA